jgi:hypothetical protein
MKPGPGNVFKQTPKTGHPFSHKTVYLYDGIPAPNQAVLMSILQLTQPH